LHSIGLSGVIDTNVFVEPATSDSLEKQGLFSLECGGITFLRNVGADCHISLWIISQYCNIV